MSESFKITWKRDPDAKRPEEVYGGSREEAISKYLADEGLDPDSVSISLPKRRLSKSYGLYTVCQLVVENPELAIAIYKIGERGINKIVFEEGDLERLKEDLDERWDPENPSENDS